MQEKDLEGRTPAEERVDIGTPAGESPESGRRRHGTPLAGAKGGSTPTEQQYSAFDVEEEAHSNRAADAETVAETEGEEPPSIDHSYSYRRRRNRGFGRAAGGGLAEGGDELGPGGRRIPSK